MKILIKCFTLVENHKGKMEKLREKVVKIWKDIMWTKKKKRRKICIEIKIHLRRTQGRIDTAENNENREKYKVKWNKMKLRTNHRKMEKKV